MENLPQIVSLVILVPAIGSLINFFAGGRWLDERWSGYIGTAASLIAFVVSLVLFSFITGTHGGSAVVNPPFLDGWIRIDSIGLEIPWQFRVDSLSVTMLLVVTGVGSLIHIYSVGYMHGDPGFSRFFAYLNMFLFFMLILVTANNYLMLFVGWEGVGLCSYLLIGFWWDKKAPEGWKNSNAARKAFILNRVGDFGVLMAMFLMFWTFGTLDFYSPGEIANVDCLGSSGYCEDKGHGEEGDHGAEGAEEEHADEESHDDSEGEDDHSEDEEEHDTTDSADGEEGDGHGDEEGDHSEDDGHGAGYIDERNTFGNNDHIETSDLGVFGQTDRRIKTDEVVQFGPFEILFDDMIVLITLFLLLGAAGKSAQIPLFVWLPDAMAGPTAVSALIHAATMVTAGVFMMVRSNVLYYNAPFTSDVVTLVGTATALVAGFIAMGQWNIKKVLAYSTVSQLGFMVAAVGIGAYVAAMFHLVTHACFKALLFLGSGSVIHGMEHGEHHAHEHGEHLPEDFDPQDMRFMGGLRRKMPFTFWTYVIATLALAGIPIFAGFWSKDEILADAFFVAIEENQLRGFIALGLLLIAAGFTAFYMWRQVILTFLGKPRSDAARHAPESNRWMVIPLIILALFSIYIGFINVPDGTPIFDSLFAETFAFKHFLESSLVTVTRGHTIPFNFMLAVVATTIGLGAIFVARRIYGGDQPLADDGRRDVLETSATTRQVFRLANAKLYWDEFYNRFIEEPFNRFSKFSADVLDWQFLHDYFHDSVIKRGFDSIGNLLSKPFDLGVIDGIVNGIGWVVKRLSGDMSNIQTGYVRTYAVVLLLGVVAVIVIMLLPLLQNGS